MWWWNKCEAFIHNSSDVVNAFLHIYVMIHVCFYVFIFINVFNQICMQSIRTWCIFCMYIQNTVFTCINLKVHIRTWWSHFISHFLCNQDGTTALMWSSAHDHLEVVAMLLEKGADVNATNNVSYCDAMYGVWRVIDICHLKYT